MSIPMPDHLIYTPYPRNTNASIFKESANYIERPAPRSSIKVLSLSQKQGATAINRFGLEIEFFVVMLETRSESVSRRRECLATSHAPIVSKEDEGGES
jgi:hypothetical protein